MKDRKWVVNASPIILLAKISKLSLLPDLCDKLVIPLAVSKEIAQGPQNDPA